MPARQTKEVFEHLLQLISSERFLKMEGLGNEIPFFICPFDPKETVAMERIPQQLTQRLAQNGVRVLVIDLFDLAIEILQERGIWQRVLDMEATVPKEQFKELLQSVLDPENHLVPAIANKMKATDFDVLFLTGVGPVYPFIRSHNVLNNLQRVAKDRPTVLFFPGEYTHSLETGASLDLFGKLRDDRYYRAFNIYDVQV